jgi:hypothetical protein
MAFKSKTFMIEYALNFSAKNHEKLIFNFVVVVAIANHDLYIWMVV